MVRLPKSLRVKWIKSVGAEFEGGGPWVLKDILSAYDAHVDIGGDGSVNVPCKGYDCSDWVSDFEIRYWSVNPIDLEIFADLLWSHGFRQNSTCGNHMHFRFASSLALYYLSDMEFVDYYISQYKNVFNGTKYLDRLNNRYSRVYYNEYELIDNIMGHGSRYHAINFISLYERQRTLEVRIMPYARNSQEWKKMFRFNMWVIESYLDSKLAMDNKIEVNTDIEIVNENEPIIEGGIIR